jgi:integrase
VIEKRERKRRDGKAYSVYRARWYESDGRERSRTFDSRADAKAFEGKVRTLKRSSGLAQRATPARRRSLSSRRSGGSYMRSRTSSARRCSNYASVYNKHLLPRIGHMRLRDLSVPTLMQLRADLEADGVGRQAVRKSLAVLQSILQRAVEWERIGSDPARSVRKPPMRRDRAITPLTPETVRAALLDQGRVRDATLVSVLAYAGVRPQEAVALRWRNVRKNTLLIEQAVADGELKGQKTNRPPRTVTLLVPLRENLAAWRTEQQPETDEVFLFPSADGQPWREYNWRRRSFRPAARAAGVEDPRPYDLRHSFASLLIHEGRHSIVEIAAQLGHNPTTCLSTYAHVIAEPQEAPRVPAEEQIRLARAAGRDAARRPPSRQLSLGDLGL